VGAFLAFTLSQSGMIMHWWRERGRHWQVKLIANGVGALATGLTVIVVGFTKFLDGAWMTILIIPLIVAVFLKIRDHYRRVSEQLSLRGLPPTLRPITAQGALRLVLPISGVHRGTVEAMRFARSISSDITAVYVELEPGESETVVEKWSRFWPDTPLVVVPSPYRSFIQPLFDFLEQTDLEHNDGQQATVILPEFVPARWWEALLHDQTAWALKAALLYHRPKQGSQRVIIDVPFQLHR
jgi:hypothetical protein